MTLPPLPEKVQIDKHESGYAIWGYTADQMTAYAQAAQELAAQIVENLVSATDGVDALAAIRGGKQ